MATATRPAPSASVADTWVLSTNTTRAATASTPKQMVKTVLNVTCEAGRTGPDSGMEPLYRNPVHEGRRSHPNARGIQKPSATSIRPRIARAQVGKPRLLRRRTSGARAS